MERERISEREIADVDIRETRRDQGVVGGCASERNFAADTRQ